ncbi:MAG: sulfatase-like hydrolase/transferase [Firmicutes bacterium]|nr:sulfatase-like hydrolase/transferase [Bacillota bacterium]
MSGKNIIFLMTDQQNPDYVGFSPNSKVATPNIDQIAASVSFANAVSPNPVCTPARCGILTGRHPHQVGMLTTSGDLSPQYRTYMQALQEAGYFTAGIGKFHLLQGWHWDIERGQGHNLYGLNEEMKKFGFDYVWEAAGKGLSLKNYCNYAHYLDEKGLLAKYRDEIVRRGEIGHPEPPDVSIVSEDDYVDVIIADRIIETIYRRPKGRPFCIFGSFLSPHPMIDPPKRYYELIEPDETDDFIVAPGQKPLSPELKQRWYDSRRGYKALIRLIDDQIGRIFAVLEKEDLLEDTVIIFTSDHGDMLGSKGVDGKDLPWRESVTVPTAIRHPDYLYGRVIDHPIQLIDLTATILDVAGLDPQEALSQDWPAFHDIIPCRSLMPIIRGEKDRIRDFAFSENTMWEMIQTREWKYIRYRPFGPQYCPSREELYYLPDDQDEVVNVIARKENKPILDWCRTRREWVVSSTPTAQIRWAPVIADQGIGGSYQGIAPYFPRR